MSNKLENINDYIEQIVNALIDNTDSNNQQIRKKLINDFEKYTKIEKLSFIKNTETYLGDLIEADKGIEQLKDTMKSTGGYDPEKWNKLMEGLSKLQVLSLINKTVDCKETTDAIINALNKKIELVNGVIEENLQTGGNIKSYKHKYLKYKSKYLRIKNNM